jgi:hypothetical protein
MPPQDIPMQELKQKWVVLTFKQKTELLKDYKRVQLCEHLVLKVFFSLLAHPIPPPYMLDNRDFTTVFKNLGPILGGRHIHTCPCKHLS